MGCGRSLFVLLLVGATVNIGYLGKVGVKALIVIIGALVFRMFGRICMPVRNKS